MLRPHLATADADDVQADGQADGMNATLAAAMIRAAAGRHVGRTAQVLGVESQNLKLGRYRQLKPVYMAYVHLFTSESFGQSRDGMIGAFVAISWLILDCCHLLSFQLDVPLGNRDGMASENLA